MLVVKRRRIPDRREHKRSLGRHVCTRLLGVIGTPGGKALHADTDLTGLIAQVDVELAHRIDTSCGWAEADHRPHDGRAGAEDLQRVERKGQSDAGLTRMRFSCPRDQTDARLQGRIHQAGVEPEPGVADGGWEREPGQDEIGPHEQGVDGTKPRTIIQPTAAESLVTLLALYSRVQR